MQQEQGSISNPDMALLMATWYAVRFMNMGPSVYSQKMIQCCKEQGSISNLGPGNADGCLVHCAVHEKGTANVLAECARSRAPPVTQDPATLVDAWYAVWSMNMGSSVYSQI